MSKLNEDIILEYLIENVNKDLIKKYSVESVLMFDYCYKKRESVPQDYLQSFVSKIMDRQINNMSQSMTLSETNFLDCLFLESYKSYLSSQTAPLVSSARTAKDFKALLIIDMLSKKVNDPRHVLNSSMDLDSKVLNLAKSYHDSNFEKEIKKLYAGLREYSLCINSKLKKPLNKDLVKTLISAKDDLRNNLEVCSKYPDKSLVPEIQEIIENINKSIDNKFELYLSNTNQEYNRLKKEFGDGIWNSERQINQLIKLRSKLKYVKSNYQLVLHKEGTKLCNELDYKIKEIIDCYDYIKDVKEEFRGAKKRVSDYHKEIDFIFDQRVNLSLVRRINSIYSDLRQLSNKSFPNYIPSEWQEDYYSGLERIMKSIKQKCKNRADYVLNQNSKYRQKADTSFLSYRTKKFTKKLREYNEDLGAWSECLII